MEREAERLRLVAVAKTRAALERKVAKAKAIWVAAVQKQKEEKDLLTDAVREARRNMDAANVRLSEAAAARNTLIAEHTPLELRRAETKTGYAYRVLKQRLATAEVDVSKQKRFIAKLSASSDSETREREHDKLVYLESICADVSGKADLGLAAWGKAKEGLEHAYGQAAAEAKA